MSTRELIDREVADLPEPLQREAYDFVRFLVRSNRSFTVEQSVIAYVMGRLKAQKLAEVRTAIRRLFA